MKITNRNEWYLRVAIVLCYLSIGIYLFVTAPITVHPDSYDYLRISKQPFYSMAFWAADRPLMTPLLFKLANQNHKLIVLVQLCLSFFSWLWLSWVVYQTVSHRILRLVSFTTLLLIGVSKDVFFWNKLILSESISFSLLVLMIACGIWILKRVYAPQSGKQNKQIKLGLGLSFAVLLWALARDTNSYCALAICGACLVAVLFFRKKLKHQTTFWTVLAVCSGIIFLFQNFSANHGKRWQFPLVNVLSQRILVDPKKTEFFVERGMPNNQKVLRYRDQWASTFDRDWSGFGSWLDTKAKSTYMLFLLSSPFESLWYPLWRWQDFFTSSPYGYSGIKDPPLWQRAFSYVVYPKAYRFLGLLFLSLMLALLLVQKRKLDWRFLVPFALLFLGYPVLFVAWHGDAMEVVRHSLGVTLQIRLGLVLLLIYELDVVLKNRFKNLVR